jgi:Tfp pilus assembly protein PilP
MPAKAKQMLMFFRGRRGAILLVAVGVALFFVLGGHRAVVNLALNEMAGFLLGTGDVEYEVEHVNVADASVAVSEEATTVQAQEDRVSPTALVSANTLLEAVRVTPAEASPADEEEMLLAQAGSDTSGAAMDIPSRQSVQTYTASFLRDPFQSLISEDERTASKLLDVSNARMVGSVWGDTGIIALLEDEAGRSYALKVGDKVVNGRVVSVTPASITFSITVFGLTRSVTLELADEGEW